MAKTVKLSDIAIKLGVSNVTVSKALSGQKGVSDELRSKIIEIADEMGYKQPSTEKKVQKQYKSFNIAVLVHEVFFDDYVSFYMQMYQQVAAAAGKRACFTILEMITDEMVADKIMPPSLENGKADGVIFIGKFEENYHNYLIENLSVPYVYLDYSYGNNEVDTVISDSYYGAYYLTNYLIKMGHTKIGFVGTVFGTNSIMDRYLGYMKSLMKHQIQVREDWIIDDRGKGTTKIYSPNELGLPKEMPTAFVCNCDATASVLIKRLENDGYKIPEDISVVGYDNYLYPGMCDVNITTYEVDIKGMAQQAVKMLHKRLSGEDYRAGACIITGHIIIRNSVRKI